MQSRTVAFYPGPAGATESELPLGAWDRIVDANPVLGSLAPDVEALIVRMPERARTETAAHLVPIDRCYELVGLLRTAWRGFDGGQEARALLDAFFADLAARGSRPGRPAVRVMPELSFAVVDIAPEPYAVVPNLLARLRVEETTGEPCTPWRCAPRSGSSRSGGATTMPRSRRCSTCSATGRGSRRPSSRSPGCTPRPSRRGSPGGCEIDLVLPCTYDFDVSGTTYLHALRDGEVPLLFLFSGTVFCRGTTGFSVTQVPWDLEARYRMPAAVWRDLMEAHFPGTEWVRMRRDTVEALAHYRHVRGLTSWDDAVTALLAQASVVEPS